MKIRLATIADAEPICRLARPLLERFVFPDFSEEGRRTLLEHCPPEKFETRLRSDFRFHVAEADGEIIGSVGICAERHLFHLFVAEAYHRQGVARLLWETAKSAAQSGNGGAGFTVNSSRYAVPVYRAFGFVEVGPEEDKQGVISVPMRYDWRALRP